jgi:hypothetical protein
MNMLPSPPPHFIPRCPHAATLPEFSAMETRVEGQQKPMCSIFVPHGHRIVVLAWLSAAC